MDTNEVPEVKRHPLAIAWDEWIASDEGRIAAQYDSLPRNGTAERYLENRLHRAFDAGAAALRAENDSLKEQLNVADELYVRTYEGQLEDKRQYEAEINSFDALQAANKELREACEVALKEFNFLLSDPDRRGGLYQAARNQLAAALRGEKQG